MALAGSVIGSGAFLTPGGVTGIAGAAGTSGTNAYTTLTAGFTVPAYGSTVQVSVGNASWIAVGQSLYIGGAGPLKVTAKSANLVTLLNPTPAATAGDMSKSVYDKNNDGVVDVAESAPWSGIIGPPTVSSPAPHATTHKSGGSDPVPLDTPAAPTDITTLNVSTAAHGLLPKTSGNTTQYFRGDLTWAIPSDRAFSRYIRQRHCDSPLTSGDASAVSGTGAAITASVNPSTTNAGHPGLWSFTSGTSPNGYASLNSSTIAPEFNNPGSGPLDKYACRFVFKTGATIPSGAIGATTNANYWIGWNTDPGGQMPSVLNHGYIWWLFDPPTSPNWYVNYAKMGALREAEGVAPLLVNDSGIAVTANTWYDARIYRDATLITFKIGVYGGTPYSTSLVNPVGVVPALPLYWTFTIKNGNAGTTSYTTYLNYYEIVGEATGLPMFLGDALITNF